MGRYLPILYESGTTVFGADNGLGALSDAIECYVDETLNEEFELVLKYPVNGVLFGELKTGRIIYAKPSPYRDPEPFRIYRFGKQIWEAVEFAARHLSYDLSGMILKPGISDCYRPNAFFDDLNNSTNYYTGSMNYEFETDLYDDYDSTKTYNTGDYVMYPAKTDQSSRIHKCKEDNVTGAWNDSKWDLIDNKIVVDKPIAVRSVFGTGENTILGAYGGEFKYEYRQTDNLIHVLLLQSRGEDNGVFLRYGINMIDLNQEKNISEMYTGVLPFYSSGDNYVVGTQPIIQLPAGEQPCTKVLVLDVTGDFSETPTNQQVTEMGGKYIAINEYDKPKVSIDIKQTDLVNFQFPEAALIELGDWVHVYYEKLGIETKAKVVSTSYDILTDKYKEIQIGDVKNTIIRTIAQQTGAITNIVNNYYDYGGGGGGGGGSATAVFG